jgi:hypothetical protein
MKLLLTSVIIFVRPGSAIQLSVGFFISFGFLTLVMWYRPYANAKLLQLQVLSLIATCLILFLGLVRKTSEAYSVDEQASAAYFVLFVNVLVPLLPVFQAVLGLKSVQLRLNG